MPLSIRSFIIVFLFGFQASWNNLLGGLIYLNAGGPKGYTVPLGDLVCDDEIQSDGGRTGGLPVRDGGCLAGDVAAAGAVRLRPTLLRNRRSDPGAESLVRMPAGRAVCMPVVGSPPTKLRHLSAAEPAVWDARQGERKAGCGLELLGQIDRAIQVCRADERTVIGQQQY